MSHLLVRRLSRQASPALRQQEGYGSIQRLQRARSLMYLAGREGTERRLEMKGFLQNSIRCIRREPISQAQLPCDSYSSAPGHSPTKTGRRPRTKKLVDKVKTGLASSEDIIGGKDGSSGHVQHTFLEGHSPTKARGRPRQKKLSDEVEAPVEHGLSDEEFMAKLQEIAKQLDPRSWRTHEGGKVFLNGVWYPSSRDPTFLKKGRENFAKGAKRVLWDIPPGKETPYECLCRLRGRRPFYEDPKYQEGKMPSYEVPMYVRKKKGKKPAPDPGKGC